MNRLRFPQHDHRPPCALLALALSLISLVASSEIIVPPTIEELVARRPQVATEEDVRSAIRFVTPELLGRIDSQSILLRRIYVQYASHCNRGTKRPSNLAIMADIFSRGAATDIFIEEIRRPITSYGRNNVFIFLKYNPTYPDWEKIFQAALAQFKETQFRYDQYDPPLDQGAELPPGLSILNTEPKELLRLEQASKKDRMAKAWTLPNYSMLEVLANFIANIGRAEYEGLFEEIAKAGGKPDMIERAKKDFKWRLANAEQARLSAQLPPRRAPSQQKAGPISRTPAPTTVNHEKSPAPAKEGPDWLEWLAIVSGIISLGWLGRMALRRK